MGEKSKIWYLLNEDDVAVKIDRADGDNDVVFDTVSKRFITNPMSMAAHISKARHFSSPLSEEEFNRIIADSLNNSK